MKARRASAPVTAGLAIATTVAWVAAFFLAPEGWLAEQGGFIPLRVSGHVEGMIVPTWLTPFTSTLIHGGFFHLAMNMLMLIVCASAVETVLGSSAVVVLYLVGAVAAAAGQFVLDPSSPVPVIGASGAISALIAVYAMLFSRNEIRAIGPIPAHWVRAIWLALGWTAVNILLVVGMAADGVQVAGAAHVGGFLIGLALARPLLAWRYRGA